ncbi:MAG TPA: SDR family oxidoreductase [Polyangiaceae bacterium]|nr:SDR family oxidoreductase [Polyangiaceae bacterium]
MNLLAGSRGERRDAKGQRVAIVTGASSGIGEATAVCLARAGFRVVVVARREPLLHLLAARIGGEGGQALPIAADLADTAETHAIVERTLDAFGGVDILVNNAGYGPPWALEQMNRDQVRHAFEVNLFGAAQLIAELTPVMRAQGAGRIINVSSLAKGVAAPFATVYAATKAALESMTDCLRLELGPFGIALCLVVPGFVHTPTFEKAKAVARAVRADPQNPYRESMATLERFADVQLAKTGIPAEAVADVIVRAATTRSPKSRYYVPFSARVAAKFFSELPDASRDWLLLRLYGLAAHERTPAPSAPHGGRHVE